MTDQEKLLKIVELMGQIEPLIQSFDSIKARLERQQENYDQQHRDAYHTLEVKDLSGAESMKWMKYVKGLARDRRNNKNTLELANELHKIFESNGRPPRLSQILNNSLRQCEAKAIGIKSKAEDNAKTFMARVNGEHMPVKKLLTLNK